ncbi:MAG: hybrid sensor histidine kinase/response regulator [Myxacorys chilensis ATA2-1-KO14]|jgi:chemotaxis protein histidine kinase CheA/CheY-like chemotaxis protein|nr:hybrid sensor histidine kinase/response regulator [Myxacorys chilensis ATA2-1-KO14]
MSDKTIRQQTYSYFLTEAQDLLHSIEQDLLSLRQERSPAKVHSLMRAAHTLKGAAASVGFNDIKTISHSLEDVFKALYNPEVEIDTELETLLFEGYECLRLPLMSVLSTDNPEVKSNTKVLAQSEAVFKQLRTKLGQHFDPGAAIPSSTELGFDITQSLFETGVQERLEQLAIALSSPPQQIRETLQTQAEVFLGLSESLNLSGFGAIAKTALEALRVNPDQSAAIAQAALADFRQGQLAVLEGDRSRGGEVSEALKQLSHRSVEKATSRVDRRTKVMQSWNRFLRLLHRPLWTASDSKALRLTQGATSEKTAVPSSKGIREAKPVGASIQPQLLVELGTDKDAQTELDTDSIQLAFQELEHSLDTPSSTFSLTPEISSDGLSTQGFEVWDDEPLETTQAELQPSQPSAQLIQSSQPPSQPPVQQPITQRLDTPSENVSHLEESSQMAMVRVNLEQLESLNYTTSELLIHQNQQVLQDEHLQLVVSELMEGLRRHQQTMLQLREWADCLLVSPETLVNRRDRRSTAGDGLKIKFDALELDQHNEVHELLQSALEELVPLEMEAEAIELRVRQAAIARNQQGRLLNYLRDDLMLARMMPIGTVLNRLPRIVQQLTETYGKHVELRLSGTQVLVDKAVAEKLFDPLLHLIRNAFDHGIEAAEIRSQQGKPEIGCIAIRAYQQGNRTLIDVQDDGGGLDLHQICQRGFELRQLPSAQVEQFSPAELLNLLFEPGFSTAKQVTELSGRGVGLDVVRSHIQSLRGNITVASDLHRGTTFSLQLPLTLMSARLLVCQVGQAVYGFLSDEVERIVAPNAEQLEVVGSTRVFHWQQGEEECSAPVHRISQLVSYTTRLTVPESPQNSIQEIGTVSTPLLLVRRQGEWVGLEVERIIGEQELVIRPMGTALTPPPYIYGCSVLGDGRLILVIDGVTLVQQTLLARKELLGVSSKVLLTEKDELHAADLPPEIEPEVPVQTAGCVLVVDDSITVRQALTFTFQEAGYNVIQAQDGLDAIAQLQQNPNIQLITCDVEMPRLNGFEFLMRYTQQSKLKQVPVIMLTSRSNQKHQQLAVQLGASAYMTKPFSEDALLSLVSNLIRKEVM